MKREPVLTASIAASAIGAIIALLVAFGIDVTEAQTKAILGATTILFPVIAGLLARSSVTPTSAPRDSAGNPLVPAPVVPEPTIFDPDASLD